MDGEIIYLFMYNTGTPFINEELNKLLKNKEDFSKYEFTRPTPEEISIFNIPLIFNLNDEIISMDGAHIKIKAQVAIYNTGSFSIRLRSILNNITIEQLHKLSFDNKIKAQIKIIAEKSKSKIENNLAKIRNIKINEFTEYYEFYYINGEKKDILKKYNNFIAGLLIDEPVVDTLDENYIKEILAKNISYNIDDIFFVGWESAVIIDKLKSYEYELIVAEIANIQFLEMRVYRKEIINMLKSTHAIVSENSNINFLQKLYKKDLNKSNLILGKFYDKTNDMLNNVIETPFGFGEWYLSKLYFLFSNVFKLDLSKNSLKENLELIEKRRNFISDTIESIHSDSLEFIIIFLIIIEVILELIYILKIY